MLNRIIRIMATATGCALLLAGCSLRLDNPAPDMAQDSGVPISFYAGSALLLDDAQQTKAAYYDDSSFGVFAFKQSGGSWSQLNSKKWKPDFMFNQEVHHSSGVYTYSPTRYWPNAAVNTLTFWAYSPYDANVDLLVKGSTSNAYTSTSVGLPDIRFTADGQTDLLYSDVEADQTYMTNSGTVQFDFNHALALVDIKAEKIDEDGLYGVTMKEVSFKGIYATGILKNSTASPASPTTPAWSWDNYSGGRHDLPVWEDDPLDNSDDVVLAHGTATPLAGVMPLPQDLTNDACWLHVEFEVSYHEDPLDPSSAVLSYTTSRNVYLRDVFYSVGSAWAKNTHYTVTLQISPDRPIQFTVSWDDWGADHNYHLSS